MLKERPALYKDIIDVCKFGCAFRYQSLNVRRNKYQSDKGTNTHAPAFCLNKISNKQDNSRENKPAHLFPAESCGEVEFAFVVGDLVDIIPSTSPKEQGPVQIENMGPGMSFKEPNKTC